MGLVKSIENFVFDFNSTTVSGSYSLTKSQDTSNCIPFVTTRAEHFAGYDFDEILSRVNFENDNVVAQIYSLGGTNRQTWVSVNVVEFDSAYADVQHGTFDIADVDVTVSGAEFNSVDLSKTFLLFNYSTDYTAGLYQHAMVRGMFTNDSSIYFERYGNSNTITGHWYTVEALNDSFSVESVDTLLTGSNRVHAKFPTQKDPNKSFLIHSYKTNNAAGQDTDYYAASAFLVGNNNLTIRRTNTGGELLGTTFRVVLNGDGQRVQRFRRYATTILSTEIYGIDESDSELLMAHIPSFFGIGYSNDDDPDDMPRAFHQVVLRNPDICQTVSGTVTSSGVVNAENIFDGDTGTSATMSVDGWVQYEFPTATGIDSTTFHNTTAVTCAFQLDASNTGSFSGEEITLFNASYTTIDVGYNNWPFKNKGIYKYYRFINNHSSYLYPNSLEFHYIGDTVSEVAVNKRRLKHSDYNFELINWKEYDPYVEIKSSSSFSPVLSVENIGINSGGDGMITSTALSKNQIPEYCVPFLTSWQNTTSHQFTQYLNNVYFTKDGSLPKIVLQKRASAGITEAAISIVEFDSTYVKVQQGAFGLTYGENSTTVSGLDTFDRDKTFLVFNYLTGHHSTYWRRVMVKGYLPSDNSITFYRSDYDGNNEDITGTWYLVECIAGDWFEVDWYEFDDSVTDNMYRELSTSIDMEKTFLMSSYKIADNSTAAQDTDYYAMLSYLYDPKTILVRRYNGANTGPAELSTFVVKFDSERLYPRVYRFYQDVGTTESEFYYNVGDYEGDRVTANIPVFFGITPSSDDDADDTRRCFFRCTVSGSAGDSMFLTRSPAKSARINFELIDWAPRTLPTHHFEGTVDEADEPIARVVRAHRADTGELVGTTTSHSGTGAFDVTTTHSGLHYVVCFDDEAGADYNDLIYGSMLPDTI